LNQRLIRCMLYAILIPGLLAACNKKSLPPPVTPDSAATATLTPEPAPTITPTPTSPPLLAVLLAAPGSDTALAGTLQTALNETITAAGLRWQVRQQLTPADLSPAVHLVVAIPPDPGLAALAAAAPQTQFLAVGIQGLEPAANLSIVGAQGPRPDQQGFIAGYIAAMLTPDWRVGAITLSDSADGRAARSGFLNGAIFFCGLCMQSYPPFYNYPRYFELPAGATSAEWQAAASHMIDYYVETVYIAPGAGDQVMLATLANAGINLIGSGVPAEAIRPNWVVSFSSDPLAQVQAVLPQILAGQGGQNLPLPLEFTQVNPELFSPGKQNLAAQVLADLLAGYIDPGVDLTTGENRE
jgi:hypothetical protein